MICHGDNLNQVCEIQEAGARRRGRPRKHGFSKSTMPKLDKKGDKCPLCKKSHELSRCPNYKIFKKVQSHYQGKLGRRKCKYCGFSKHNKATCPVMREAQQILKEKENQ
jgi:hypothetical protein